MFIRKDTMINTEKKSIREQTIKTKHVFRNNRAFFFKHFFCYRQNIYVSDALVKQKTFLFQKATQIHDISFFFNMIYDTHKKNK